MLREVGREKQAIMIFLAHAFENRALVQRVEQRLREENMTPWVAPGAVEAGLHWMAEVVRGIESSPYFVCLITKEANHSEHVQRELGLAQERNKRIIPVVIGRFRLSEAFQYMLTGLHHTRVPARGKGAGAAAIVREIMKVVRSPRSSMVSGGTNEAEAAVQRADHLASSGLPQLFGVNYMRLFGALEVPFLMDLMGANFRFEKAFDPFLRLEPSLGVHVARRELVDFWKREWPYKKARPLLNPLWCDIAGQKEEGKRLYWRALNGTALDIAGYASHPDIDEDGEHWERAARAQGLRITSKVLQQKKFTRSAEVGFLFGIFEYRGKKTQTNVTLDLEQWKNPLVRDDRFLEPRPFRKNRLRIMAEALALKEGLQGPKGVSTKLSLKLAEVRPKDCFITLLQVYRERGDGLPRFHLTDAHLPKQWTWTSNDGVNQHEGIRPPAGLSAARIQVPSGWFGQ